MNERRLHTTKEIFSDVKRDKRGYVIDRYMNYSIETSIYNLEGKEIDFDYQEYQITNDDIHGAPEEVLEAWYADKRTTEQSRVIVDYYLKNQKQ